jgi:hypothetical protein
MHASPEKKGAAGEVFLLAFADGSFGMYNKQVVKLVKVVKAICGDVTCRVALFVTRRWLARGRRLPKVSRAWPSTVRMLLVIIAWAVLGEQWPKRS